MRNIVVDPCDLVAVETSRIQPTIGTHSAIDCSGENILLPPSMNVEVVDVSWAQHFGNAKRR